MNDELSQIELTIIQQEFSTEFKSRILEMSNTVPLSNYTKVDICPLCKGTGRVVSESEQERNKGKRLIKG